MAKQVNTAEVINAVLAASPDLSDIPKVVQGKAATLQETGGALLAYKPFMNEFISTLVNRILFQEVHDEVYYNQLRILRGADIPYGTDVQDNIANPAIATPYDATAMADVLTPATPDVKTVYYRRNRQDKYKVTIFDKLLKGAFIDFGPFDRFYNMLKNTLVSGDQMDEYEMMVAVMASALDAGSILTVTNPDNADEAKLYRNAVRLMRTYFLKFRYPSTLYNGYLKMATEQGVANATALKTWTDEKRMSLFIRADVLAAIDVEVLAAAFNMEKANFLGRLIIVDTFGTGAVSSKTMAIVADITAFRFHDNLYEMADTPYNAATLSRNFYLHHWQTMAFSPFANCVAIIEEDSTPVTPPNPATPTANDTGTEIVNDQTEEQGK